MTFDNEIRKINIRMITIIVVLLFLSSFSGLFVEFLIKNAAAKSAAIAMREDIILGNFQKVRSGFAAVKSDFSFIKYVDLATSREFLLGENYINFHIKIVVPVYLDELGSYTHGVFFFYYSPFKTVFITLTIWLFSMLIVFRVFHTHKQKVKDAFDKKIEIEKSVNIAQIATQVAHDIRSPLSVLNLVSSNIQYERDSENIELMKSAIKRIEVIAEDLLRKDFSAANFNSDESVVDCLAKIVREKQFLIDKDNKKILIKYNVLTSVNFKPKIMIQDLERIMSNILNNSIESLHGSVDGLIEIKLFASDNSINILIRDNGTGMPENILNKVGTKGFTFGKKQGSGLGLYSAKKIIENVGGHFNITSRVGVGTEIQIRV